jgi:hypothetical protein
MVMITSSLRLYVGLTLALFCTLAVSHSDTSNTALDRSKSKAVRIAAIQDLAKDSDYGGDSTVSLAKLLGRDNEDESILNEAEKALVKQIEKLFAEEPIVETNQSAREKIIRALNAELPTFPKLSDVRSNQFINVIESLTSGYLESNPDSKIGLESVGRLWGKLIRADFQQTTRDVFIRNFVGSVFAADRASSPLSNLNESQRTLVREGMNSALTENAPDLCDSVCHLADKVSTWGAIKNLSFPSYTWNADSYDEEVSSWTFATTALSILFLTKSAPYCDSSKGWLQKFLNQPSQPAQGNKPTVTADSVQWDKARKEIAKEIDGESVARMESFLESVGPAIKNRKFQTSLGLYGLQFYLLTLRELQNSMSRVPDLVAKKGDFSSQLATAEKDLITMLNTPSVMRVGGGLSENGQTTVGYGSLGTLFEVSTASLSIGDLKDLKAMKLPPKEWELELPYKAADPFRRSKKGSAASAVPFSLLSYRQTGDFSYFDRALDNFIEHSPSLISMIGYSSTHFDGADRIAPYYYYPAIPFATAGLRLELEKLPDGSAKKDLLKQKLKYLSAQLANSLNADGNLKAPKIKNSEFTSSSIAYANPLAGLAMLPAIEACKGKTVRPSLGILDANLLAGDLDKLLPHGAFAPGGQHAR